MSGRTHSDATKQIMSDTRKGITGENHPRFGKNHSDETKQILSEVNKGKTLSDETRTKISDALKGTTLSDKTKTKISDAMKGEKNPMYNKSRPEGAGSPSQQIEVTDIKNNTITCYNSISEAAIALNIKQSRISEYFSRNQKKPYKGQYTFKKSIIYLLAP